MKILEFINKLRESDEYIEHLFTMGSCYRFACLLKEMYPGGILRININKDHVVYNYGLEFYDIKGLVTFELKQFYTLMSKEEIEVAEEWSFRKGNCLKINECPACEEPITYSL